MKHLFLTFFLAFTSFVTAQNFENYFTENSLRIDFFLFGDAQNTQISVHKLKKEKHYAGSKNNLIYPNYGNFRLVVKDLQSQKEIFAKGFSPIFKEWQSTPEAKTKTRIFENVLKIPFPKSEIVLEFYERKFSGKQEKILSQIISPTDYRIINETPLLYPITTIQKKNSPEKAVDLVVIAEGYTEKEMDKFIADTQRLTNYLFTIPPFDKHQNKFNIYAIKSPSLESGTDLTDGKKFKNTILNSQFYTFDTPRYLTAQSLFTIADICASVPYDQIYVLVNTAQYGGGGFYNVMNLVSADNKLSDKVFVHEFGHGFIGLADEYYDNSGGLEDFYNLKIEPWEPNITTLVDFNSKWKNLVSKNTPIPTPRTSKYQQKVGAFEGGGYFPKGIFSPVQDCRMKSNVPDGFCPVCSQAIEKAIIFETE